MIVSPSGSGRGGGHSHAHRMVERGKEGTRLRWVLGITSTFMLAEAVGGWLSGSLAPLADAGHMFTDAGALGLSLFAMRIAERPASPARTYGYVRLEVLAALVNGATLLVIAGLIVVEAWERLRDPIDIDGVVMLSVAILGMGVNVAGALLLHDHAHDNLNVRGAYLHVMGDLLGSVGAGPVPSWPIGSSSSPSASGLTGHRAPRAVPCLLRGYYPPPSGGRRTAPPAAM